MSETVFDQADLWPHIFALNCEAAFTSADYIAATEES